MCELQNKIEQQHRDSAENWFNELSAKLIRMNMVLSEHRQKDSWDQKKEKRGIDIMSQYLYN